MSQDIRRERELRERTIDGFQAMLRDERDRARETAARLEEENALLLWLLAEAVWKLQLESAKSWAREQAGKPYERGNWILDALPAELRPDTFIAEDTRQSRMADAADMETHGGES